MYQILVYNSLIPLTNWSLYATIDEAHKDNTLHGDSLYYVDARRWGLTKYKIHMVFQGVVQIIIKNTMLVTSGQ